MSDDFDNAENPVSAKRKRKSGTKYSPQQREILETAFAKSDYPASEPIQEMAKVTGLTESQVKVNACNPLSFSELMLNEAG